MMLFRQKITESLEMKNDLANFWLRKTKKLVLAVLIVEKNGQVKAYSGKSDKSFILLIFVSYFLY